MVHRDIKTANLLVQLRGLDGTASLGLVKISDFGLARLQVPGGDEDESGGTILTRENTVMGTPDYLSPEQARSLHKTDIRSDLYSLGCTFHFLLTGDVPFPGGTALEKMIRHTTEVPRPPAELRGDVPPQVSAIVAKLMAKHPDDRFQTPAALAAALEPFAVSGPTPWAPVRPPSTPLFDEDTPLSSNPDIDPDASHEMSALVNTVARDQSPTPRLTYPAGPLWRSRLMQRMPEDRRLKAVVILATGIVCGLIAAFGVAHLLMGR
jgi:serine/threonine-protein kinase